LRKERADEVNSYIGGMASPSWKTNLFVGGKEHAAEDQERELLERKIKQGTRGGGHLGKLRGDKNPLRAPFPSEKTGQIWVEKRNRGWEKIKGCQGGGPGS